jgi:hypothetical protein
MAKRIDWNRLPPVPTDTEDMRRWLEAIVVDSMVNTGLNSGISEARYGLSRLMGHEVRYWAAIVATYGRGGAFALRSLLRVFGSRAQIYDPTHQTLLAKLNDAAQDDA